METNTLRTFIALAQIKNFTKTAQQLFVAQSTVTNRIRDLESELGKPLFVRNHKQIELTAAGEKFLEYAQRFIVLENTALQELHISPAYSQQIRIGTTNTIYESHLQKRLRAYLKTKPSIALQITISHTQKMLQDFQASLFDVIFTFSPLYKDGCSCRIYRTDALVLVVEAGNTEYVNGIYKKDLLKINYLFCNFALQGVGLYIQDLFPRHHRFPFEIDNSTKLVQYIKEGLGYTFLPYSLIEDELTQGTLRAIPLLDFSPPKVNSYYITREPAAIPKNLESFLLD